MSYRVQGINAEGHFTSLEFDVGSPREAERLSKSAGLEVLEVVVTTPNWLNGLSRRRHKKYPLLLFNQELLALLEAGLSVVEAIETLFEKESRVDNQQVLKSLVRSLHEGLALSAAFAAQPAQFPDLYIATIRSSERSGNLAESIRRYASYQRQLDVTRKKIITASIYPALLLGVGSIVILFLLIYVIPRFSHIYSDTSRNLSTTSRMMMQWGTIIEDHGTLLLGVVLSGCLLLIYLLSRPQIIARLRRIVWRLPIIGERMRVYQLARFYRTLGMLLSAGIPIMSALGRVEGLLNLSLQQKLMAARELVRQGQPLSIALDRNGLSTTVSMRLLRVGERSGRMGAMMEKISDFHEEELNRWIDVASRLFEPLIMTFVGVVIGIIVVLMYIPIFELAGSIQ